MKMLSICGLSGAVILKPHSAAMHVGGQHEDGHRKVLIWISVYKDLFGKRPVSTLQHLCILSSSLTDAISCHFKLLREFSTDSLFGC